MDKVIIGSELKLNINIEPIGGLTMDDYDFEAQLVVCGQFDKRSKTFSKAELIKQDPSNYVIAFNTSELGFGKVTCVVIAHLPDTDFSDGIRTEIVEIDTGIEIIRRIG